MSDTTSEPILVRGATPAAASGPEHVEVPVAYDAILLAGFGGPEGQDDVIPFLRNVTRGRGIPEERLEEVAHHYRHFGGVSPINAQNRALKKALEAELANRGIDLPVLWGNRNWAPYMSEAVAEAKERGFTNLLAIATSAYSSFSSCRQYREDYAAALEATGLEGELRIDKVRQFFDHPGFVMPFVKAVHDGLDELRERMPDLDVTSEVEVLFSTHSIPMADAERSGPHERHDDGTVVDVHEFGPGGAYEAQHLAVAEVVMAAATDEDVPWQLVYQSRSGPPTQPWLEPDINDAIAELPARGRRALLIVPLGFVSDHMEVMWDLDNEALETSEEQGLVALRVATPGTDPVYVSGLIDLVLERVNGVPTEDRPSMTALGPWYDVCRPGCCENVRAGFKPALAGVAP
ncbi:MULTISPECIES: ferrochelatase [unclassified Rathayibacter]|uniref:ferrochelatase n=1 Tax=unclassified Rathayibacter TaxID=2609250 RepID=UPI000CE7FB1D|nr:MULTISPECIES: ferrochelatase [unclassified Rathayibacter]PPF16505.1 ferrochelatase [Rathayibacter sp. AY1A4]PPG82963.1 ferrochelatase [Rathayibacter sp. AY1E5]PPH31071.1 ferrochelatase [Rathayibacter sp. AY1C3]PPH63240.1 ferrochelatase [Rathayibacter sp. AY1D7]PPI29275.1 ferrochelatase [Rathayibacter sp. AY1B4]